MNKFEKLIDLIVNEDSDRAKKLFHEIVVENSRKIYEELMENDNIEDELEDDIDADEEGLDESEGLELSESEAKQLLDWMDGTINETDASELVQRVAEHFGVEVGALMPILEENSDEILDIAYGDDEADAIDVDDEADAIDVDDEADEADIEDRVIDLEDAIDELQAEFDQLIADEKEEDEGEMEYDEEPEDEGEIEEAIVREYVEKVPNPSNNEEGSTNRSSVVASKNDMGGTAANIAAGSQEEKGGTVPAPKKVKGADNFENAPKARAGKAFKPAQKAQTKEPAGTDKSSVVK